MISGQQAFFFLATWWAGYFFPSKCSAGYFFPSSFLCRIFFFTVIKWGWEACTTPTSRFRTLRLTCLGLSTNFAFVCCSGFSKEDF